MRFVLAVLAFVTCLWATTAAAQTDDYWASSIEELTAYPDGTKEQARVCAAVTRRYYDEGYGSTAKEIDDLDTLAAVWETVAAQRHKVSAQRYLDTYQDYDQAYVKLWSSDKLETLWDFCDRAAKRQFRY